MYWHTWNAYFSRPFPIVEYCLAFTAFSTVWPGAEARFLFYKGFYVFNYFFSFVSDQTKTSTLRSLSQDFESSNL